ncbi:hypothetical protein Tco_0935618 [Tanacetum coccineum]
MLIPDHKTWYVPSTNDCMNKVLTCQTRECVINEMYGAVICDACESTCHLQFNSEPISGDKQVMSSSTTQVQQSIEKKVQSSDGNNNQKKMSSVTDALLNLLSQNGIKLECNQENDMREDEEDVEWVGDNFVKTSENLYCS